MGGLRLSRNNPLLEGVDTGYGVWGSVLNGINTLPPVRLRRTTSLSEGGNVLRTITKLTMDN